MANPSKRLLDTGVVYTNVMEANRDMLLHYEDNAALCEESTATCGHLSWNGYLVYLR